MATHSSILAWRNPMDGGAWLATVQGVAKSQTLSTNTLLPLTPDKRHGFVSLLVLACAYI